MSTSRTWVVGEQHTTWADTDLTAVVVQRGAPQAGR
ncbi:hypothetical protein SAMN05421867_10974 [Cellulomonas marina]|uniref:Uncharacterized protein n=1 Tax=Cellulomonas marina TaxID=988821 RepID=A0A1I0Z2C2_9CELL|nr:hypothetical protein SAMN05421867_10974 [Cellulomonas marina]